MKIPSARRSSSSEVAVEAPHGLPTQTASAIHEQIPLDQIAGRIGEMIQARQPNEPNEPNERGDLESDWSTVEAGGRPSGLSHQLPHRRQNRRRAPRVPDPKTALSERAAARRETQRIYTNPELENIPRRPTARVLPGKNQNKGALEPLENMRKLLILETPLADLQGTQGISSRISSLPRANTSTDLDFEVKTSMSLPPTEKSPGRNLPLAALVACLVIGGIFASASQFHTRPQSSSSSSPMMQEKPQTAETAPPQKREPASGLTALKPRFETSMW